MPLVNDYAQVKDIYKQAAEMGVGLPTFCAEDRETLEAILASAYEFGRSIGVDNLPIIPAWTSRYPGRGQMKLVTACGEPRLGVNLMFSDIRAFMGDASPYRNLLVMPHMDHAFPWLDGDSIILAIASHHFRRVPIVESGKVVGIISRRDIIRVALQID